MSFLMFAMDLWNRYHTRNIYKASRQYASIDVSCNLMMQRNTCHKTDNCMVFLQYVTFCALLGGLKS